MNTASTRVGAAQRRVIELIAVEDRTVTVRDHLAGTEHTYRVVRELELIAYDTPEPPTRQHAGREFLTIEGAAS